MSVTFERPNRQGPRKPRWYGFGAMAKFGGSILILVSTLLALAFPAAAQHLPMPVENQSANGTIVRKKQPDLTGDAMTTPVKAAKKKQAKHSPGHRRPTPQPNRP